MEETNKRSKTEEWPADGELCLPSGGGKSPDETPLAPTAWSSARSHFKFEDVDSDDAPPVLASDETTRAVGASKNPMDLRRLCSGPVVSEPIFVHIYGKTRMKFATAAKSDRAKAKGELQTRSDATVTRTPRTKKTAAAAAAAAKKAGAKSGKKVLIKKDAFGNVVFSESSLVHVAAPAPATAASPSTPLPTGPLVDAATRIKSAVGDAKRAGRASPDVIDAIVCDDDGDSAYNGPLGLHEPIGNAAVRHFQFGCFAHVAAATRIPSLDVDRPAVVEMAELSCDKHRTSLAALRHVLQEYLNYEHLHITCDSPYVVKMTETLSSAVAADANWISPTQKCADLLQQIWVLLRCRCVIGLSAPALVASTLRESATLKALDVCVDGALDALDEAASKCIAVHDLAAAAPIMNDAIV